MNTMIKTLIGSLAIAVLAGAAPATAQSDGMSSDARKLQEELQAGNPGSTYFGDQFVLLRVFSEAEVNDMYRNRTNRYVHPEFGQQVEYTAADGSLYLWHPRYAQILAGRWRVDGGTHLCYDYTRNTGGILNRGQRSGWECEPISVPASIAQETLPGDVLDLARTHNVPFRLRRDDRSSLSELAARIYANGGATSSSGSDESRSGGYGGDLAPEATDPEDDNRPWWRRVIGETPDRDLDEDDPQN